jgi:hypothetical protein
MKYVCLCYDEEAKLNAMSQAERDAVEKEVCAYNDELRREGQAACRASPAMRRESDNGAGAQRQAIHH